MKKLIKNKKGIELPGALLVDVAAVIVFIFIALFFFILFLIHGCSAESQYKETMNSMTGTLDLNTQLNSLLRTPINVTNVNLTFAELGILSLYNPTYQDEVNNFMKKAFKDQPYLYGLKISKGVRFPSSFGNLPVVTYSSFFNGVSVQIPAQDFELVTFTLYRMTEDELKLAMISQIQTEVII